MMTDEQLLTIALKYWGYGEVPIAHRSFARAVLAAQPAPVSAIKDVQAAMQRFARAHTLLGSASDREAADKALCDAIRAYAAAAAQPAPVPADTSDEGSRYDRLDAYMRLHCSNAEPYNFAKESAAPVPVPPGWKLVPVEPTPEMLAAADASDREYSLRNFGDAQTAIQGPYDHYRAMIAASPEVPK
jgi:hypothetical protein